MSERNEDLRLRDMLDAARAAVRFAQGKTLQSLDEDDMLLYAIVRAIEIIGEASRHVSEPTRQKYSQIPWVLIAGMRNRLAHGYFDINRTIVWKTVTEELPPLIAELEKIV